MDRPKSPENTSSVDGIPPFGRSDAILTIRNAAAKRARETVERSGEARRYENLRKGAFVPFADAEGIRTWFCLDESSRSDRLTRARNWSDEWKAMASEWNAERSATCGFRIPETHT